MSQTAENSAGHWGSVSLLPQGTLRELHSGASDLSLDTSPKKVGLQVLCREREVTGKGAQWLANCCGLPCALGWVAAV